MHHELSLGVMARSLKENERRLPLHPDHLRRIPPELRARIYLETGYGHSYGITDSALGEQVAGVRSHADLVAQCDIILQPKPILSDVAELRDGQVLWGWPHCVQDRGLTQVAIDRRLTMIAFEAMNHWHRDGSFSLHVFHKNNELAGYSSVLHATALAGFTGDYGPRRRAAVIGFGATARGAVTALNALGIHDVSVLTQRETAAVASPIPSAHITTFGPDVNAPQTVVANTDQGPVALADFLAGHDIIVNCVLQDPGDPMMFLTEADLDWMTPGTLIIDVSCDEGMGFSWARPTSFTQPTFLVGDNIVYYAVDHSPSYLWSSATWENSEAILPFLATVMGGPKEWDADSTISRAIEIREGVIQNPAIISFQRRASEPPYAERTAHRDASLN